MMEGLFRSYDYPTADQVNAPGDKYQIDSTGGEVPLEHFNPNLEKPLKIIYKETKEGLEETEEGDSV